MSRLPLAPERQPTDFRSTLLAICRDLQIVVGLALSTLSLFFIGPEMKRADASVSSWQQVAGVVVAVGAYLVVALVATRDIRWTSLLAICLGLVSTPVFALLWLMSGWSMPAAEAGRPLLFYIGGNVALVLSALVALLKAGRQGICNTR